MRSLELAIKYLAGERMIGTAAERAALTTGQPDYELGTEASGITSDPSFTSVGGHRVTYDSTNDELDITPAGSEWGSTVAYYKDILDGTISDTAWVLRMKWVQQGWSTNTGSNGNDVHVDLSSVITNNIAGDTISTVIHNWSSNQGLGLDAQNNAGSTNTEDYERVFTPSASTTYYIQMRRLDSDDFDIKIYTGSDFSTGQQGSTETKTISGIADLRYLRMFAQFQSGGGTSNMSIKWFKFWDDTTTATAISYPNLSNGTLFEESDTGKHYMFDGTSAWNEVT